ncbi:RcpC/CpaB family pilus assembly protein, partial [Klebsiella pneumoniae]|uniref:RcpC/CpaB family pilus assembly protein n=1 Tax=Klebsiella pneumoniae TaxID=573 RepID=UPI0030131CA4
VEAVAGGQPLERRTLVAPRERGFLSAAMPAGLRAISIAVDEVSGNAGLIYPSDRVDLLLTSTVSEPGIDASHRVVGETV